jgi:hypothetical protein
MAKKKPETIYQIRISLDHIRPPIWRRVLVPGKYTLGDLHLVIQVAMGWQFSHLHEFVINDQSFTSPDEMEFSEFENLEDESSYRLMDVVEEGSRFHYEYDFGDSWEHTLFVEKVFPAEKEPVVPVCIKGKRACPPEDVGGFPGYQHFLEAMANPDDPDHDEYLEWFGGSFDPEAFDLKDINQGLASLESDEWSELAAQNADPIVENNSEDLIALQNLKDKALAIPFLEEVKSLPMLGTMIAMLSYIRENKVTGTKSRGNFPRKAVLGMIERSPLSIEMLNMIDMAPGNFRTEEDILPVYYVHVLAAVAGWIVGGADKRWQLTRAGEAFLNADPRLQLGLMFITWWYHMDWTITAPIDLSELGIAGEFRSITYRSLISIPVNEEVSSHEFLEPFLKISSLFGGFDGKEIEEILSSLLATIVLVPLHGFGIIQINMDVIQTDSIEIPKIKGVKLTPLGKEYLSLLPAQ